MIAPSRPLESGDTPPHSYPDFHVVPRSQQGSFGNWSTDKNVPTQPSRRRGAADFSRGFQPTVGAQTNLRRVSDD